MKSNKVQDGFTLMELILYIGLTALILVSAINVSWDLLVADAGLGIKRNLYFNTRFIMHDISQKIRNADDVIILKSTFDSHPGVLILDYPSNDDVIFDTYIKIVDVGQQQVKIRKLRIKEGTNDYVDLTSDSFDVSNIVFTNLTRGKESKNINIELTLEAVNSDNDANYDISIQIETAISVRK